MGEKSKFLALSTLNRGNSVTIEMKDGSEKTIEASDVLNELLSENQSFKYKFC